ncbi:MAG TPA: GNAT family N-acetyltransferase [Opitutaceae bacterium]|nr:GNAT family N-acetyltransferase [Opitutaceae bacterium]
MRPLAHFHQLPPGFRVEDLPLAVRFGAHRTVLRWLGPDDAPRLLEFFKSHTPDTIRNRYGYLFTDMSSDRAARLVNVDQLSDAALGVFEDDWHARLVAIGRYCLAEDKSSAELAFVVREDRRNLGIASTLIGALIAIAREREVPRLTAQIQSDNGPMLAIFRQAGATFASIPGSGATEAVISLDPPHGHRH